MTNKVSVEVSEKLFSFDSFEQWVVKAESWYAANGLRGAQTLCLDQRGRILTRALHFQIARHDGSFPVDVYAIRANEAEL